VLRIAFTTRFAWPVVGGVEQHVRTLAGELAQRHDVRVFAHRIDEDGTEWKGELDRSESFAPFTDPATGVVVAQLRLQRADLPALLPLGVAAQRSYGLPGHASLRSSFEHLHRSIAGRRFTQQLEGSDVVHRFGGNRMSLATVRAAKRLAAPVAITPFAHPGQWDCDPISAQAYREADLIVASSRADAATYTDLGVDPRRIGICPLPTEAPAQPIKPSLRERGVVTSPLVLFLGARRPHKGVNALLQASRILAGRIEAQVAFVGPGSPLATPVPPNVLDIGAVDEAERQAWLEAADVVCLPSSAETWGLVVSEAWSHGLPVVTSDIPVLKERLDESGAGLAVPAHPQELAAAVEQLLRDDLTRQRMGTAGRRFWSDNLTPAAIARWHEAAYQGLAAQRSATATTRERG
jgi:glycosyltransferase involved in cell wall biosynthesis